MRALTWNPVLRRELTERWRGRRAFVVLTAYVLFLAGVTQLLYWAGRRILASEFVFGGLPGFASGPTLGRFLFENLLGFVLLLVLFIAPGYAAAQISGERERRSLPLLQVTLLRPWQIVAGKLGASLAWLLLLVVAALPFAAAAFFLGGVAWTDLLRAVVYILGIAVAIAGMGLGISSLTRRTAASVVLTYALVLFLLIGSLFGAAVEFAIRVNVDRMGAPSRPASLYLNPFYGLADAARVSRFGPFGGQLPSVLTMFAFALPERQGNVMFVEERVVLGGGVAGGPVPMPPPLPPGEFAPLIAPPGQPPPPSRVWLVELGLYGAVGAAGLLVATRRVRAGRVLARAGRQVQPATGGPPPAVGPPPPPPPGTTGT